MIIRNQHLAHILSLVLALALTIFPAQCSYAAPKDGCYIFTMNQSAVETLYTADGTFRVKKSSMPYVSYGKKKFNRKDMQPADKNYDFEIADKVYTWQTEDPTHAVKKYGVKLSVTHDQTLSGKEFAEQFSTGFIVLYLIVKDGKIVAAGASA